MAVEVLYVRVNNHWLLLCGFSIVELDNNEMPGGRGLGRYGCEEDVLQSPLS